MMLRILPLLLAFLLVACGNDVRDRPLAEIDLSNMKLVHHLAQDLGPRDGEALITYAALHDPVSAHFCGERLVDGRGNEPKTIRDAIALTLQRTVQTKVVRRTDAPKTPAELLAKRLGDTVFERDMVSDRESFLLADHGLAAKQLPEWRSLESRKADLKRTLISLQLQLASLKDGRDSTKPKQTA